MDKPILGIRAKGEEVRPLLFEIRDREDRVAAPAMFVLVNPQNFKQDARQLVNKKQTRGAFVEEYWGQELDEITFDASTAAFVSSRGLVSVSTDGGGNVTDTEAYHNFQALVSMYRSNGEATFSDGQVVRVGSVWMTFDDGSYQGEFRTFSVKDDAEKPFVFTLSATFRARRSIIGVVQ